MSSLIILALAVILSVLQAAFFSALPAPFSTLQLPLVLIIGLVTGFRFRLALLAGLVSGATLDMLTSSGSGIPILIMLAVATALIMLFTRTLTHLTVPSFIAINFAGFTLYHFLSFVFGVIRSLLAGFPHLPNISFDQMTLMAVSLLLQTLLAAALLLLGTKLKKMFFSSFFVVH